MLSFSRLNLRKLFVTCFGDAYDGCLGGSMVHGDVHQAIVSSHLCSRLPGDQNSSAQERRPDVAPQGRDGNE